MVRGRVPPPHPGSSPPTCPGALEPRTPNPGPRPSARPGCQGHMTLGGSRGVLEPVLCGQGARRPFAFVTKGIGRAHRPLLEGTLCVRTSPQTLSRAPRLRRGPRNVGWTPRTSTSGPPTRHFLSSPETNRGPRSVGRTKFLPFSKRARRKLRPVS